MLPDQNTKHVVVLHNQQYETRSQNYITESALIRDNALRLPTSLFIDVVSPGYMLVLFCIH
jgi:hypothetical protein